MPKVQSTDIVKAAKEKKWERVKAMLEDGYDPNVQLNSRTALHYAAEYEEWCRKEWRENIGPLYLLLVNEANIEAADEVGSTPLHFAARKANEKTVRSLLEAGANVEAKDIYGSTALIKCAGARPVLVDNGPNGLQRQLDNWKKCIENTCAALLEYSASVNAELYDGGTALMMAARGGNLQVCELLMRSGADSRAVHTGDGTTALHWAAASCSSEVCRLLVDNGASLDAKDKKGRTPLDVTNDAAKSREFRRDSSRALNSSRAFRECQIMLVVDSPA